MPLCKERCVCPACAPIDWDAYHLEWELRRMRQCSYELSRTRHRWLNREFNAIGYGANG